MSTPLIGEVPVFCACRVPVPEERVIFDSVEYEVCKQCGFPIEETGVSVDEEE